MCSGFATVGSYIMQGIIAGAAGVTIVASGSCGAEGDNVTYTLDSEGTLIISGSGEMKNYGHFDNCSPFCYSNVKKVIIKDGVTSISECAFEYCKGLTSIVIPDSVHTIGKLSFSDCIGLTSIVIPDSVTSIGGFAFSDCKGLTSIVIPDSVTSIGGFAFSGCKGLTSIVIPDSVTSIEGFAFYGCTGLASITIPDSVTLINDYTFSNCTSLTSITIGNRVTEIGNDAFYGCVVLTSIVIPDSVHSIGELAFYSCTGLTSIVIPDSVHSIGRLAFYDCDKLKDVYYSGTEEEWKKINIGTYNNCLTNATIHFNSTCEGQNENPYIPPEKGQYLLTFRTDTNSEKTLSHQFEYDDSYFAEKSTVFNHKLAILTLGMVMSGFSAGDSDEYWSVGSDTTDNANDIQTAEKSRVENISHTYNLLGFDKSSIEYYNYDVSLNDASDKVAFSIASKKIHVNGADKTLVAVILRGGGYGSEWSSNFNMGSNGLYHEAFNNAAWEVADKVIDYLGRKKLTQNVKILMGGFSRAAAAANLAAAKLDKLSNSNKLYSISRDDIYTYTFATPQGIVDNDENDIHNSIYNNIFNIINPRDIVPTVALTKWKFGRYGITKTFNAPKIRYYVDFVTGLAYAVIPDDLSSVCDIYRKITGKETTSFNMAVSDIKRVGDALYKMAGDTKIFENKYQGMIMNLCKIIHSFAQGEKITRSKIDKILPRLYDSDTVKKITYKARSVYNTLNFAELLNHYYAATSYSSMPLDLDIDEDTLYLFQIMCAIIETETGDISQNAKIAIISLINSGAVFSVTSLMYIGQNHYPELYLAWLKLYDDIDIFKETEQYKVSVKCPVDVDVYSNSGELLASVKNNEIASASIPVYIENDCKEFWMSSDDIFDIRITAYDSGTMNYSLEEYDQNLMMQKRTNFYSIPLKKNSVFETTVSSSAGESVTLYDKDSKKTIYPSETLTKDDEEIEISVSCDSNGHVYGNQNVVKGEYVSVTAVPNDGYIFKGWFKENKLVSKDLEYYFNAIENINLVARFEKIKSVLGDTNGDGKATIADSLMIVRYEVKLRTLTDEQLAVSDVNYDGKVTIADALKIARYEVKLIDSL